MKFFDKVIIVYLLFFCLFFCQKLTNKVPNEDDNEDISEIISDFDSKIIEIDSNQVSVENILKDGDTWKEVEKYSGFRVNEPIVIRHFNKDSLEIINYVPKDIENVYIAITVVGVDIILFKLKKLKAHTKLYVQYPFKKGQREFYDTKGNKHYLDETTVPLDKGILKFSFHGGEDDNHTIEKIKNIKCKWKINFRMYGNLLEDPTSGGATCRPVELRIFINLVINMAYVYSTQEFMEEFYETQMYVCKDGDTELSPDLYEYKGNGWTFFMDAPSQGGKVYNTNKELIDVVFNNRLYSSNFRLDIGIASFGGAGSATGYGGTHVLSVAELRKFYNGKNSAKLPFRYDDPILKKKIAFSAVGDGWGCMEIFAHELGHNLGFMHNSNWAYAGKIKLIGTPYGTQGYYGFVTASSYIVNKYVSENKLIINKKDYYRYQDFTHREIVDRTTIYTQHPIYK